MTDDSAEARWREVCQRAANQKKPVVDRSVGKPNAEVRARFIAAQMPHRTPRDSDPPTEEQANRVRDIIVLKSLMDMEQQSARNAIPPESPARPKP